MTNDLTRAVKVLKKLQEVVDTLAAGEGVDLSEYPTKTEVNAGIAGGVSEAKEYTNEREVAIGVAYTTAINDAITALKGVSPETLDTLQEIAEALNNDPDVVKNILVSLGEKASVTDLTTHVSNTDVHVTEEQKSEWSGKVSSEQLATATTVSDETLKAWLVTEAGA